VIARAAIVVAALLVAVWLVSGLRPVRDERAGIAAVQAKDVPRGYRLLERAAAHSRSTGPDLRLAQLDAFTRRPDHAVRRLQPLVRREPENFEAWVLLAQTAAALDPPLAARARARARALSPPVPRRR
jgi:predicted Zn-dependent protease